MKSWRPAMWWDLLRLFPPNHREGGVWVLPQDLGPEHNSCEMCPAQVQDLMVSVLQGVSFSRGEIGRRRGLGPSSLCSGWMGDNRDAEPPPHHSAQLLWMGDADLGVNSEPAPDRWPKKGCQPPRTVPSPTAMSHRAFMSHGKPFSF